MNLMDVLFSRALVKGELQPLAAALPAAAGIDAAGLITFQNSDSETLFTVQLPLYAGGVE